MVLIADAMVVVRDGIDGELAVGGCDGDEFAAGQFFRSAALVGVDVRGFGAEHGLERAGCGLQAENVGSGAVEDEEDVDVSEVLAKLGAGAVGIVVVAVADGVAGVGGGQGFEHFGMHAGVVIAGETANWLWGWGRGHLGKLSLDFGEHQIADDRDVDDRANEAERVKQPADREQQAQGSESDGKNAPPALHQKDAESGDEGEDRKAGDCGSEERAETSEKTGESRSRGESMHSSAGQPACYGDAEPEQNSEGATKPEPNGDQRDSEWTHGKALRGKHLRVNGGESWVNCGVLAGSGRARIPGC